MSVSASGESPMSRGVVWAAHSLPYVVLGWVAYSALQWFQIVIPSPLVDLAVAVLPMSLAFLAFSRHQADGSLCLRCIQEVPVDAEQRAQGRYAWVLRVFHYFTASIWRILQVVLVLSLLALLLRIALGYDGTLSGQWTYALSDLLIALVIWSQWKHHRYRPWCPFCRRWDEGGDEEFVPDPVPAPGKTVST